MITFRMDKSKGQVFKLGKEPKEFEYWLTQPIENRLDAIEFLRKQMHPDYGTQSRLERVYRVIKH